MSFSQIVVLCLLHNNSCPPPPHSLFPADSGFKRHYLLAHISVDEVKPYHFSSLIWPEMAAGRPWLTTTATLSGFYREYN